MFKQFLPLIINTDAVLILEILQFIMLVNRRLITIVPLLKTQTPF